jgi:hypothetical protein
VEPYIRLARGSTPPARDWHRIGAYVGLAFTLSLMACEFGSCGGLPPVGYAIRSWSMNCLWLPILIAWGIKLIVMRYAGPKTFHKVIPIALGLILGEFIIGSLWCILGIVLQQSSYSFWV